MFKSLIFRVTNYFSGLFVYVWPIEPDNFVDVGFLIQSISKGTKLLKGLFVCTILLLIASGSSAVYGQYITSTKLVPDVAGEVVEGNFDLSKKIRNLNPVLTPENEFEERLTSMLYLPLYKVEKDATIPILLSESPKINERSIAFKLKKDLKWSDGSALNVTDVTYTFQRLKEDSSNIKYNKLLKSYDIKPVGDLGFEIYPIADTVPTDLELYKFLDFSPISKVFFESKKIEDLAINTKSLKANVTSGYYFMPSTAKDFFSTSLELVQNPTIPSFFYKTLTLERNPNQNYQEVNIQKYIFSTFEESDPIDKLDFSINLPDKHKAGFVSQNTTLQNPISAYFNLQTLPETILRKYISCKIKPIAKINYEFVVNSNGCENIDAEILGSKIQKVAPKLVVDAKNKISKLMLGKRQIKIEILVDAKNKNLAQKIQSILQASGVLVDIAVGTDSIDVQKKLTAGTHNILIAEQSGQSIANNLFKDRFGYVNLATKTKQEIDVVATDTEVKNYIKNPKNAEQKTKLKNLLETQYLFLGLENSTFAISYKNRKNLSFPLDIKNWSELPKLQNTWQVATKRVKK